MMEVGDRGWGYNGGEEGKDRAIGKWGMGMGMGIGIERGHWDGDRGMGEVGDGDRAMKGGRDGRMGI